MKRIKVLHVITHLGVGGALDNTLLTVERLPRDCYEVHLAAGPLEDGYSSWEERAVAAADRIIRVPALRRAVQPQQDLQALRQLTRCIREQRYDVVHTHCAKAGVLGRFAAFRVRTPVIVHTCHAFGMQVTRVPLRRPWMGAANRAKEKVFATAERQAARLSDRVITVCEQNRRQAIDRKLAPAEKLRTIYSGIDQKRFVEPHDRSDVCAELGLDATRPVVGFLGRLAEQKAPLDYVAAAKKVLERRPDAQFLLAGDGPMAADVDAALKDEPRIHRLGFYEDAPRLLAAMDVLAVSSLWEGLGRSVTEAILCRTPVAATAVDGIPELIEHETTGLLSLPRRPAALAENIVRLLNDPQLAAHWAAEAFRRMGPEFNVDQMVQRIDDLYQEIASEKGLAFRKSRKHVSDEPVLSLVS